jgi:hypothetical protein
MSRIPQTLLFAVLIASNAAATSVPSQTFEELTDRSELVVSGQIARSWSDWDSEHKFIWTHYELKVSSIQKGAALSTVVFSEPGGEVGDRGMAVAGSVGYRPGEQVAVFLERMPNGYLRTTGWGQGKYTVDNTGHLHPEVSQRGSEFVQVDQSVRSRPTAGTPIRTLDGITVGELRTLVAARVTAQHLASTRQGSAK